MSTCGRVKLGTLFCEVQNKTLTCLVTIAAKCSGIELQMRRENETATTAVVCYNVPDLFLLLMVCKCFKYSLLVCKFSL